MPLPILRIFFFQPDQRLLTLRASFQNSRRATDQDIIEPMPVFVIVIDQESHLGIVQDIANALYTIAGLPLRFVVNGGINRLAVEGETHRHQVWGAVGSGRGQVAKTMPVE